jgi:hypothetical protein
MLVNVRDAFYEVLRALADSSVVLALAQALIP